MVLECGVRWLRLKLWSCRARHSYARVSKQASKSLSVCVCVCVGMHVRMHASKDTAPWYC